MAKVSSLVTSLEQLSKLYREPSEIVAGKKVTSIEDETANYLAASSFCLIATSDAEGRCDVSPRGGHPGFVRVLDATTLAIPDLSGNNLIDTLKNIVANPHIGLLSVIGGLDETVRFDGAASLTTDASILNLWDDEVRRPKLAIVIDVDSLFIHCAKSFRRAKLWDVESWPTDRPSIAEVYLSQVSSDDSAVELAAHLESGYARDLAAEQPD